jgi:hypothetical protein
VRNIILKWSFRLRSKIFSTIVSLPKPSPFFIRHNEAAIETLQMMDQIIASPLYHTRTHEKKAGKYYCPRFARIYDSIVRTASCILLDFMASENVEKFFWAILRLIMFKCSPKLVYIS